MLDGISFFPKLREYAWLACKERRLSSFAVDWLRDGDDPLLEKSSRVVVVDPSLPVTEVTGLVCW